MAAIQVTLPGSKDGFISGNLGVAESLDEFNNEIAARYAALVNQALSTMTNSVQSAARAHIQWAPYADHIIAAYADGSFFYTIASQADADAIHDLEYGTPGHPPVSILRSTLLKDIPTVSKMLEVELV